MPTPMKLTSLLAALGAVAALTLQPPAHAGEGHDHGAAAPAATGTVLPRFAATSESFELVGVLKGRLLTLYLDRSADNAPVAGATIELEIAGAKFTAQKHEDVYEVELPAAPKPGVLPITATVTAGSEADLLAGELDLHEAAPVESASHAHGWTEYAAWAAAALAALVALTFVGRRIAAARHRRAGEAA